MSDLRGYLDEYGDNLDEWFPDPQSISEAVPVERFVQISLARRADCALDLHRLLKQYGWSTLQAAMVDAIREDVRYPPDEELRAERRAAAQFDEMTEALRDHDRRAPEEE